MRTRLAVKNDVLDLLREGLIAEKVFEPAIKRVWLRIKLVVNGSKMYSWPGGSDTERLSIMIDDTVKSARNAYLRLLRKLTHEANETDRYRISFALLFCEGHPRITLSLFEPRYKALLDELNAISENDV